MNQLDNYSKLIGNTPIIQLDSDIPNINIYAKMEFLNPSGSMKDRAALRIVQNIISENKNDVKIIESSSGNFGIALASICSICNIDFYCVIDKDINLQNKRILETLGTKIIIIDEMDSAGGYLKNRIKKVEELLAMDESFYWINQYDNKDMIKAYYDIVDEAINYMEQLDYIFVPVSSGGTITGISQRAKKINPSIKVIAVDVEGSVIFGGLPKKRHIPGMGSSIVDDVVVVSEESTIECCDSMINKNAILIGGSTGASYQAIIDYFAQHQVNKKTNVLMLYCDRGERYIETLYNDEWRRNNRLLKQ